MRKQVTWALGNTLVEGSKVVEENHFLFDILKSCGDTLVSRFKDRLFEGFIFYTFVLQLILVH